MAQQHPSRSQVSNKYSLQEIVFGHELDLKKHYETTFGSCVKAYDNPTVTNTMCPRTFPRIFRGPTGNRRGTHKVFDINTGVVEKSQTITPLPMPDRVISVVEDWGRQHFKENKSKILIFLYQKREQYN
jgi:hypothetical protein